MALEIPNFVEQFDGVDIEVHHTDTMAEAGRKVLLANFQQMLRHEAGSRIGEDPEDVHQMRVATRRMRSAFRVLEPYYKAKPMRFFRQQLKQVAEGLGAVRDLDVMLENFRLHAAGLDNEQQLLLESVFQKLDLKRQDARKRMVEVLDSSDYNDFNRTFSRFLSTPGKGAIDVKHNRILPHQVRHIAPVLVHQHLAAVRAYDILITDHNNLTPTILHALRIEFKRLRYTLAFFSDTLGATLNDFTEEIKVMQDYLGYLNDSVIAHQTLSGLNRLKKPQKVLLDAYLETLDAEVNKKIADFPNAWTHFNSRAVQRKLSDALLALR